MTTIETDYKCAHCGTTLHSGILVEGAANRKLPKDGDAAVCFECGGLNAVSGKQLVIPSPEIIAYWKSSPMKWMAVKAGMKMAMKMVANNPNGVGVHFATKAASCPSCNQPFDVASSMNADSPPEEGDPSVCVACGAISMFGPNQEALVPTKEQMEELTNSDIWDGIESAQNAVAERIRNS